MPADAGLGADRRLPGLEARVAERALLGLAALPVEVDLLVRAAGDAHPPAPAGVLVDEHDPVLLALVHRARRAGGDAGGVEAVLADPRQVEHERALELEPDLLLGAVAEVGVGGRAPGGTGEVVLPVRPPLEVERLAGQLRLGPGDGLVLLQGRGRQRLVVVGPGLVVVVERGEVGVEEDVGELPERPAGTEAELATAVEPPAAAPLPLVFPALRVAEAGLRLDVVEPHVLGAAPVRPDVLAGDRAGVAADALVEVHHHRHLGTDAHQYSTSRSLRTTASSSRWGPVGP